MTDPNSSEPDQIGTGGFLFFLSFLIAIGFLVHYLSY